MRKKLTAITILIVLTLMFIGTKVNATTPTLEQIAETFNSCATVQEYTNYGTIMNATVNGNILTITVTYGEIESSFEYTLDDTILSITLGDEDAFTGAIATIALIDSIGQLHGYADRQMFQTLNSDEINNYTLANEGIETKVLENEQLQIKVDINKKIPLVDFSNVYIKVSDLDDLKEFISGDGSATDSKGNVWYNKFGYHGENVLLVAEKDNLTENTYKSILSIIEVMFESDKASEYFASNYSGMSVGDKEFAGVKIEVNPAKTENEENLIPDESNYKFVRITIDKELVSSQLSATNENTQNEENENNNKENNVEEKDNNTNKENNSTKEQDKTTSEGKLPQTGLKITLPIISVVFMILIAIISGKKYRNCKDI